jgi:hypothetical protein
MCRPGTNAPIYAFHPSSPPMSLRECGCWPAHWHPPDLFFNMFAAQVRLWMRSLFRVDVPAHPQDTGLSKSVMVSVVPWKTVQKLHPQGWRSKGKQGSNMSKWWRGGNHMHFLCMATANILGPIVAPCPFYLEAFRLLSPMRPGLLSCTPLRTSLDFVQGYWTLLFASLPPEQGTRKGILCPALELKENQT